MEEAGLELARLRIREERPVVAEEVHAKSDELSVLIDRDRPVHVVVAGETSRDEIVGSVLDPLDGTPDQERRSGGDNVAGIDRHLVAEASAEVRGDDADLFL